jgi:NAD(P)-dependent dehydrogenase (short-subunit alcohol dehydrogenase family)
MLERNSVAFVTGAGSGLGKAAALAFAHAGAKVVAADIELEAAESTAHEIARVSESIAVGLDVTQESQVSDAIARTRSHWGRIDHAFNNAGIRGGTEPAHAMDEAAFRRVLDVNVVGVFLCQKELLAAMYAAGRGAIVNMASIMAFATGPGSIHYTAAKHAVVGLTKAAAIEAAARGVRVNAVAPGTIETPLTVALAGSAEAVRDRYTPAYPMGRLGKPKEVADAVVWLCSDQASFVTGHTLVVDGGYLLR